VFPEGGLTRDGRMREPKLGVLDYMLRGFNPRGERDLVFVPLALNYDRVLEDRTLIGERRAGRSVAAWRTFKFVLHNAWLMARSEWHRFGYACVNFGTPISMRKRGVDYQALSGEARRAAVAALGAELMQAVGRIVPVLPVPLIASVFVSDPRRALSALELKTEVGRRLARLEAVGAHVYIPRGDLDYALTVGLRMLRLRHLVDETDGLFRAREEELPLLAYYAHSISHLADWTDG
jgi:glycerol-3-phosphate O-acyltransferase